MSYLEHNLSIFEIIVLKTKWKDGKISQTHVYGKFSYTKQFYVHEIVAVDLSKICFLKDAKKTCKPNNRDLNRYWTSLKT